MRRKITDLEQRLIDKGYYLSHKQYSGRKSEKTHSYTYVNKNAFVKLDFKRENVISYGLLNYSAMELTRMEWQGIGLMLNIIEKDIDVIEEKTHIVKENFKVIQLADPDEQLYESTPKGTFEEIDELNAEKENNKCH